MAVRPRLGLVLAALLVAAAIGCGNDAEEALPPGDDAGLAEVFRPYFEPLGLRFTYGSIDDLDSGPHLALYVEPTGPATDERYLERVVTSAAAVVPFLFDEYPGLNSFDICQEPVPTGPDDPEHPEPRTVVVLSRAQAGRVEDWSTATLADLMRAASTGTGGKVDGDDAIEALPGWVEAEAEAGKAPTEESSGY